MRGIGDRRAIPALIRSIPRLLQPPRSDYGLEIEDEPALLEFMQRHDTFGNVRASHFNYSRAIREIMITLQNMTGETHGWMELNFAFLEGGAEQERIQRGLFLKLAQRWADWWSQNWRRYVKDEAEAQLSSIQESLKANSELLAAASNRPPRSEFPCGPNVTLADGFTDHHVRSFEESPSSGFLDLDTGRHARPPEELVKKSTGQGLSTELLAWAEREGVDLINIRITPPGSDHSFYAFEPVGMKVWRIENNRFDNLHKELRERQRLELPAPWQGPLVQLDEKSGRYDDKLTASFLFITKEGTCGAIRLESPLSIKMVPGMPVMAGGGLQIRFIYERPPAKPTKGRIAD